MAVAENKSPGWVGEMCFVSNVARVASKNASSREELAERVRSHESEMRRRMCTCAPAVPVEVDKETTGSLVRWVRTLATELKAVDPCAPDILSATTDAEVAEQLAAPAQLLQIDPASEVASASASAAGAPSLALARDLRQLLAEVSRRRALAAQLTEKLGSLVRQLVSTTAGKGNAKLCWLCGLPPLLAAVILSDPRHTHLVSSLMTDRTNHGTPPAAMQACHYVALPAVAAAA
ncbi:hypothetical protein AB1Y20_015129 [Prymnesium parvum]|uniref:Uncharacterized protein n=1 Tax=Prymnesium parvum TaxID=97485 RepID=A0AB34JZ76_PRYPA